MVKSNGGGLQRQVLTLTSWEVWVEAHLGSVNTNCCESSQMNGLVVSEIRYPSHVFAKAASARLGTRKQVSPNLSPSESLSIQNKRNLVPPFDSKQLFLLHTQLHVFPENVECWELLR